MTDIHIKQFDTRPGLEAFLQDGDGEPVDLSGTSVVFSMGTGGSRISRSPVVIISENEGLVRYDWQLADAGAAGNFDGEFEVTYSNGDVETFPRSGYISVAVESRLSTPAHLFDLAITSATALSARVTAAFGQATGDRFLDLNGDGFVTGADSSLAISAISNMTDLKNDVAGAITSFELAPATISAMIDGSSTPVPVATLAGNAMLLDLDDSGAIDDADFVIAQAMVGA